MDLSGWFATTAKRMFTRARPGEALESVMVNHFGGDEIMDLIVELARQADAVINLPPLLTRTEQREQLPPDHGLGGACPHRVGT
jgi:hypothetical protein